MLPGSDGRQGRDHVPAHGPCSAAGSRGQAEGKKGRATAALSWLRSSNWPDQEEQAAASTARTSRQWRLLRRRRSLEDNGLTGETWPG